MKVQIKRGFKSFFCQQKNNKAGSMNFSSTPNTSASIPYFEINEEHILER